MSSERRSVRPFLIDGRLHDLLDHASLWCGGQRCEADGGVLIGSDFESCPVLLRWADSGRFAEFVQCLREGVIGTGLRLEDTCVVVTARSSYLKLNSVVFRHSLSDPSALEPEPRLDISESGTRHEVFSYSTHGAIVDAYVALDRTLQVDQRRPLVPWRVGTWLSRTRFHVMCSSEEPLFRPRHLTQEKRSELGVPAGTVTYAQFDGRVTDLESEDVCDFWVDEELLNAIHARSATPEARVLQRWLFAEFLSVLIHQYQYEVAASSTSADGDIDDLAESLIGRVLRTLAGRRASDDELKALIDKCKSRPNDVLAMAQYRVGLRNAAIASLKGGQS